MFGKFKIENNDQRKFTSNLFGIGCIAWASPIYNFLINLNLQRTNVSVELVISLLSCLFVSVLFFVIGLIILGGANK